MEVVAAVFVSGRDAEGAAQAIRRLGGCRVDLLNPGTTDERVFAVPTTQDMPPVIKYLAVTLGAALGLGLGAGLFLLLLDMSWPLGLAATVLTGIAGAALLGRAGRGADRSSIEGLPADELFVYRDALRQGRTVVIVRIAQPELKAQVKELLDSARPEDVDPAREDPEVGLRSSENLRYDPPHEPSRPESLQGSPNRKVAR